MRPKHPNHYTPLTQVYVSDKFAEYKCELAVILSIHTLSQDPRKTSYWVMTENDRRDLFFHDELTRLTLDRTPAGVSFHKMLADIERPRPKSAHLSFETLMGMLRLGILTPLDDPLGTMGGRKSGG